MPRIRAIFFPLLLAIMTLLLSGTADAQVRAFVGFGVGYGLGHGGYGYRGYGYGYGGGTVAGNYMNGMSNVIRAEGQYNLLTAQAGVNNEEARSKYLDNQKKWRENYLQGQEQHQKLMAEKSARSKLSPEALAAAAASDLPRRLGPDALDPVTGQITWPELLRASGYAAQRKELEQLFELRAKTTHTPETSERVLAGTSKMSDMVRKDIQNTPPGEYIAARKFLDSLAYAAR